MAQLFKVGERVRFLHEKSEGVVQRILSAKKLEVLVDDFFEMVVDISDVVRIDAGEETFRASAREEETLAQPEVPLPSLRKPELVIFQNAARDYEVWLDNGSADEVLYTFYKKLKHKYRPANSGSCAPQQQHLLLKSPPGEFHEIQHLYIQLLRFPKAEKANPVPQFVLEIPCKRSIFKQRPAALTSFEADGWSFVLEEDAGDPFVPEDFEDIKVQPVMEGKRPTEVVDLHIHRLVDNPMGISSEAMLQLQIEAFERNLTDGHRHHLTEMVFIHGIGTGRLKNEIHARLREYSFVDRYELANPMKYGNGATHVYFSAE